MGRIFFSVLCLTVLCLLQLVGPMNSAVPMIGSVCLRPGGVMGRQTVWMGVMSSSVSPLADLARFSASVETSVLTTTISVTEFHIAGMPPTRA